jgi:hypothetical protein
MKSRLSTTIAMLLMTGLLAGCGAQNRITGGESGTTTGEDAEVAAELAQSGELVDEAVFEAGLEAEVDVELAADGRPRQGEPPAGIRDSLRRPPLRFWRRITGVRRSFEFAYRDTDSTGRPVTAEVRVHKTLSGAFFVAMPESGQRPVVVRKTLLDHWVRRLVLHRVDVRGLPRPVWRVVGTSGVQITSRPGDTRIVSVRIQGETMDTTVTDPLAIFRLRGVMRLDADDSLRVTVTTLRNDDVVVLQMRDRHLPFRNNGDNTYSFRLRVPRLGGVHHLGINALAHGTLFEARAAYDSQAWILPYVVPPTELADAGRP